MKSLEDLQAREMLLNQLIGSLMKELEQTEISIDELTKEEVQKIT